MKTILLFRHAKSDWTSDTPDIERPLAERGRKAAVKMGRLIAASGAAPERVLASSAVRTRETARLAAEAGFWKATERITDALYEATPEAVLAEIQSEPDEAATLVVIGHEPTTSRLAALLVGGGTFEVKTASVLRIDVPVVRWADIGAGRGALVWAIAPETLDVARYRQLKKKTEKAEEKAKAAATILTEAPNVVPGAAEAAAPNAAA
ncbi:MAG TPA: histidine phosphatase family protein [Rubricoccaceae bacterium]|jgi:phosphohistidine phosphatase